MGEASNWAARPDDRSPRLAVILGLVDVGTYVAEVMQVEGGVECPLVEVARFQGGYPGGFRQSMNVAHDVGPGLTAIARELQVAVVRANPDDVRVFRRFADRVDRGVHLGHRVVNGDTARLLLRLLPRIVGREIRRDPLPDLPMVAGAEQELC